MAIAVIGGLISFTLLSLVFVPVVFAVMDDIGRFAWCLFSRFGDPAEEEPAVAPALAHPKLRPLPAAAE